MRLRDAIGRELTLDEPARRIVSLVPSETESVVALAGVDRLVGRTEWCEEPVGRIEDVPTVGGTKNVAVAAVIALAPDLVLANKEENTKADIERLVAAGVDVHVSFPCSVAETAVYLEALAGMLGVKLDVQALPARGAGRVRTFTPIWRDPWMTFDGRTYSSDLLAHVGAENVFADRARRFPLAADLGDATPIEPGDRDTRYPRLTVAEIEASSPELVLLPDEPFRFEQSHVEEVRGWNLDARVELVSGKDLFWYGVRTAGAIERLRAIVEPS